MQCWTCEPFDPVQESCFCRWLACVGSHLLRGVSSAFAGYYFGRKGDFVLGPDTRSLSQSPLDNPWHKFLRKSYRLAEPAGFLLSAMTEYFSKSRVVLSVVIDF